MTFLVGDASALLRTLVVGVLAYVALVAVLRLSGKRTLSQFNAFDFVVTVALGSTLATILLSRDVSLLQGVIAFLVLVGMQFAISWSSIRSGRIRRAAKSEPAALLYRGRLLEDRMRQERVLASEIEAALRANGLSEPRQADLLVLETDGTFTVIERLPDESGTSSAVEPLLPVDRRLEDARR